MSVVLAFLVGALIGGAGPWEKWLEGRSASGAPNMLAVRQDHAPHSTSVVVPNIPMLDFMEIVFSPRQSINKSMCIKRLGFFKLGKVKAQVQARSHATLV